MDTTMLKRGSAQALMQLVRRLQLEINTAIPGEIVAFNATQQIATVKPCIKGTVITNQGKTMFVPLPQIIQVPVFFPYSTSTGFSVTYPVAPGDQCLIVFSQRSFDNWLARGSIQNPSETGEPRSHQYSDALALVGFAPNPMVIQDFQEAGEGSCLFNGIEIRNKDRNSYVKVMDQEVRIHEGKADIDVHADGTIELSIHVVASPNDGLVTMTGMAFLKIAADGTTTLVTPTALNVTAPAVSLSAETSVSITSPTSTVTGNMTVNGNLTVTNNMLAKTYSVGSGNDIKAGATGSSDFPSFQAGIVV